MKFRKKPVVIEAMQWDGSAKSATPIIDWALPQMEKGAIVYDSAYDIYEENKEGSALIRVPASLSVDTLEGRMRASAGDFIIQGVNGEFYPCKPDIFEKTYEAVEDLP